MNLRTFTLLGVFFLGSTLVQGQTPVPTTIPSPAPTPKPLTKKAVVLKVPFVEQDDPKACGLAVLKMISGFYGQKLNQPQLDWIKNNSTVGVGVMASELLVVLGAADFETALFQGTLDDKATGLFHHLDNGRPLIVMITAKDGKTSHYDIVNGYDPADHRLVLVDPAIGPVTVAGSDFEGGWERANHFTLLAVPKKLTSKTPTPSH